MKATNFPWGWLGAGLVSLVGLAATFGTLWWLAHAERTIGTAGHTSYSPSGTAKAAGAFTVHVHITTRAGEPKVIGITTWSRSSYPEGSPVPVVYDAKFPAIAKLDTWLDLWLLPGFLLLWGGWWSWREWRKRHYNP